MTTPHRRPLAFHSLDEVMPDVERLLKGHTTVGHWSLAQICRHLATVMTRIIDLPVSTPADPSKWVAPEEKQKIFAAGRLPEAIPAPPEITPPDTETLSAAEEAESLRQAIAHYRASATGPVVPHRIFGPLTREEWDQLQLIHLAHHLSFAIPSE